MPRRLLYIAILIVAAHLSVQAQRPGDTLPPVTGAKYPRQIARKTALYDHRLSAKTEKTLVRLSRSEERIQKLLQKASPETAQRLFGNGQPTFGSLLQQLRQGALQVKNYRSRYDAYRDSLTTIARYLYEGKEQLSEKTASAWEEVQNRAGGLDETLLQTEYIKSFIKERKRRLISETMKYAGDSRALRKINRESYYYVESLKNYRELFSNESRREELMKKALSQVPAFQKFMRDHSVLSSLFAVPGANTANNSMTFLAGLQTRASVQDMIQRRMAAGGPTGAAQLQQNLAEAQGKLTAIKDKLLKGGHIGADGDVEMPGFKPNSQRSKTLWQRLEYRFDVQFSKSSSYLPAVTDIGAGIGYKLEERIVIGAGLSCKLGMGSIEHIRLSSEGIGLRSFMDWRLKGRWYASGGYEMNYMNAFKNMADLEDAAWQRSGLIGISRQYSAGKRMKGEVKVLWDFMARKNTADNTPLKFRVGYRF